MPAASTPYLPAPSTLLSQPPLVPEGSVSFIDFLELSAPADLPAERRPEWLPLDGWERLRDLGKIYPYNKILPVLFESEVAAMYMARYYQQLTEVCVNEANSVEVYCLGALERYRYHVLLELTHR